MRDDNLYDCPGKVALIEGFDVLAKNNEATTELDNRLVDGLVGIRSAESPAATTEQVSPTGGVAAVDNFTLSTPGPTATAPKGGGERVRR